MIHLKPGLVLVSDIRERVRVLSFRTLTPGLGQVGAGSPSVGLRRGGTILPEPLWEARFSVRELGADRDGIKGGHVRRAKGTSIGSRIRYVVSLRAPHQYRRDCRDISWGVQGPASEGGVCPGTTGAGVADRRVGAFTAGTRRGEEGQVWR